MLAFKSSAHSKTFRFSVPEKKIIMLTRTRQLPHASIGGTCFPLSIHCRSQQEAERVWHILQPIADVMENEGKADVAAAFMVNVVVRKLFQNEQGMEFFAAFLGFHGRPVVYLSW